MECVTPHLQEVPENHWYCGTCVECKTCKNEEALSSGVKDKGAEEMRMITYKEGSGVDQSITAPSSVSPWGTSLHQCHACAAVIVATAQVEYRVIVFDYNVIKHVS